MICRTDPSWRRKLNKWCFCFCFLIWKCKQQEHNSLCFPLLHQKFSHLQMLVFLHSLLGKESTWNAGDPGSIPESGRSTGEGIGYPLQYSWASLVTQLVKNPPAMWETWFGSLGWEDPLEKGKATHYDILAWRIQVTVLSTGLQRVDTTEQLSLSQMLIASVHHSVHSEAFPHMVAFYTQNST